MKFTSTRLAVPVIILIFGFVLVSYSGNRRPSRTSGNPAEAETAISSGSNARIAATARTASAKLHAETDGDDATEMPDSAALLRSGSQTPGSEAGIAAPEAPVTEGFAPVEMNTSPIADPTEGLTFIAPPAPQHDGAARLSYPILVPPARNGMAPNLEISYDSDIADGWLGSHRVSLRCPRGSDEDRPFFHTSFPGYNHLLNRMEI